MKYLHYSKNQKPGIFTTLNNNIHWGNNVYVAPTESLMKNKIEEQSNRVDSLRDEILKRLLIEPNFDFNSFIAQNDDLKGDKNIIQQMVEAKFEQIRMEKFSHLPSRKKCMWLYLPTVDKELVLKQMNFTNGGTWYEVEVDNGRSHVTNPDYLDCQSGPYERIISSAINYWNFTLDSNYNPNELEVLFEGTCKITPIV